mmetsp:Transcript_46088/g.107781  ORF Transcript_46088/g.107781 Transcript_46088/m.107781 type:complete len:222 (-) Transcript_46088:198-863(-)
MNQRPKTMLEAVNTGLASRLDELYSTSRPSRMEFTAIMKAAKASNISHQSSLFPFGSSSNLSSRPRALLRSCSTFLITELLRDDSSLARASSSLLWTLKSAVKAWTFASCFTRCVKRFFVVIECCIGVNSLTPRGSPRDSSSSSASPSSAAGSSAGSFTGSWASPWSDGSSASIQSKLTLGFFAALPLLLFVPFGRACSAASAACLVSRSTSSSSSRCCAA